MELDNRTAKLIAIRGLAGSRVFVIQHHRPVEERDDVAVTPQVRRSVLGKTATLPPQQYPLGYTIKELAHHFGFHYDTTRRHFNQVEGILRRPSSKPFGRERTQIFVPAEVALREIGLMTRNPPATPDDVALPPRRSLVAKSKLRPDDWDNIIRMVKEGHPVSKVARAYRISRQAIHQRLKRSA